MKPQIEIEIKARLKDKRALVRKLKELGANFIGKKHQIDYYFSPPHMSYVGKGLYFRVRHDAISKKSRLEYHDARSAGGRKENFYGGKEYEIEISDYRMMLKILELLDFKREVIIDKVREEYTLGDITVELDKVKGLGNFIEIEMLNENKKEALKRIKALASKLGIPENEFMHKNYFRQMYEKRFRKDG